MTTKAYTALINEPILWMLTPHGDGYALGWKGPQEAREKCYNLFCNFYEPRPFKKKGLVIKRPPPRLTVISDDTSYIYLFNLESIKKTLTLYFEVMASREMGRSVPERIALSTNGDYQPIPESAHANAFAASDFWENRGREFDELMVEESQEDQCWEVDESEVKRLAEQDADAFIPTIKHVSFIPSLPKPHADTYGLGRLTSEEHMGWEDYASMASS